MGPTPEDLSVTGFDLGPSVPLLKEIVGCLLVSTSSAAGMSFQSFVDTMSSLSVEVDDPALPCKIR